MGESPLEPQGTLCQRRRAALDAVSWGFPRSAEDYELDSGLWYRIGDKVVFWYEAGPEGGTNMALHIAVNPDHRGKWPMRAFLKEYLDIPRQAGAKILFSFPLDDVSGGILSRLGWTRFEQGLYRNLESLDA